MRSGFQGKSNHVIDEVAGCGLFQVVYILFIYFIGRLAVAFSMVFMAFGIYNPGWRCLDQVGNGSVSYNMTILENLTSDNDGTSRDAQGNISFFNDEFFKDHCPVFEICSNIEFEPSTSTLITEWGLLCDKAWIARLIISAQMIGILIGSGFVGPLADAIGRKTVLFGSQILVAIVNALCIFSVSWTMFVILRFFLGIACSGYMSLSYVIVSEVTTTKWRAAIAAIPAWGICCIFCGFLVMVIKKWVVIHIAIVIIAIVGLIPFVWIPESLRWLEVKHKTKEFLEVAKKITKLNRRPLPSMEDLITSPIEEDSQSRKEKKVYTFVDLFRPGYKLYTLIICYQQFVNTLFYYVISFGVYSLSGNFYINFISMYASDIPFQIFPLLAPNILGRKLSSIIFMGGIALCFIIATGFAVSSVVSLETTGIRVIILIAKAACVGSWCVVAAQTTEIFPTVVRGNVKSLASLGARIGGTIAPFLIPSTPSTKYITYAIMGCLGFLFIISILPLPETRGKLLKETFNDRGDNEEGVNEDVDQETVA